MLANVQLSRLPLLLLPHFGRDARRPPAAVLPREFASIRYAPAESDLIASGRGPVPAAAGGESFPDRFRARYGGRYSWQLLRTRDRHYFLLLNGRDIKPIGQIEAACRWRFAARRFRGSPAD